MSMIMGPPRLNLPCLGLPTSYRNIAYFGGYLGMILQSLNSHIEI